MVPGLSEEDVGLDLPFEKGSSRLQIVYTMAYNMCIHFEWSETKNKTNFRKHKVWFEEAQTLWVNPRCVEFFDPDHSEHEDRFVRVGHSSASRILLAVFCENQAGDVIRIISARKATTGEIAIYEEGI